MYVKDIKLPKCHSQIFPLVRKTTKSVQEPTNLTVAEIEEQTVNYHDEICLNRMKPKHISHGIEDDFKTYSAFKKIFSKKTSLDYDKFCYFLSKVEGQENVDEIALEFTDNLQALALIIHKAIKIVKINRIKARLKRLAINF